MTSLEVEVRPGAYYDSVVLMQLQRSLVELDGVADAGVVMGTAANKELLAQNDLLLPEAEAAKADDLVIVVKADDAATARGAIGQVDELLTRRRSTMASADPRQAYRPQSLDAAVDIMPESRWVLVSVPGRYAARVAREALQLDKNVFLYSDNVALEDEVALKKMAADRELLMMGPDCGTAIVNGVGLGFANAIRRGPIGIVAASGTGLQAVSTGIHHLGSGVSHALGTGGRDLAEEVGALTARQALTLLDQDPDTQVVVLISKPPAPGIADQLLKAARSMGKPVVVDFVGYSPPGDLDGLHFASTFDAAARKAVELVGLPSPPQPSLSPKAGRVEAASEVEVGGFAPGQRYLRGLFSGGTLAYEAQLVLRDLGLSVHSNVPLPGEQRLADPLVSEGHTIVDLGEDVFTVGRLHPMLDNELRIRRLYQEADDPEVAVLMLDVVLGFGAHPDPAGELAPAIKQTRESAVASGRHLEVVAVIIGTDADPQGLEEQMEQLREAGAHVETSNQAATRYVGRHLQELVGEPSPPQPPLSQEAGRGGEELPSLSQEAGGGAEGQRPLFQKAGSENALAALQEPLVAINVGLETFAESLTRQDAAVLQVDWRPPAGGDERLMGILERMKQ